MNVNPMAIEGVYFADLGKTGQFILAIKPRIFQDRIEWSNSEFDREYRMTKASPALTYGLDEQAPDTITIETAEGKRIILEKLVLKDYAAKVQKYVKGKQAFGSTQELTEHYLNKVVP